jgi:AcrR family transcriptional regulator
LTPLSQRTRNRKRRSVQPQPGRRERRRTEIRERLYSAALGLFAERGYLQTTVEDITDKADVGKGTFFNYFPTKEHVLATFGGQRIAAVEHALEMSKKSSPLKALRELAADLAGHTAHSPALLRTIYAAHASCEPVRAELLRRLETGRHLMTEIFTIAQEKGEIRRDMRAADLARLAQLLVFGVSLAWAMKPDAPGVKTVEDVWDLFAASIRPESTDIKGAISKRNGKK